MWIRLKIPSLYFDLEIRIHVWASLIAMIISALMWYIPGVRLAWYYLIGRYF